MNEPNFGATGKYPRGRLNEDDEGELTMGIAADLEKNVVVINFGTPVAWFALERDHAVQMAELILQNARKLGPVTISV